MKLEPTLYGLMICLYAAGTSIAAPPPTGIGGMAQHMLDPVFLLSDFVSVACFLIGGSFIFASIIKYVEHRRSPLMVPISTVVSLFIGGLLLVGLPFMWMLAKYANG